MADHVPEDMPVPKVPIDVQIVADAADEHGVARADLVAALEEIDAYLLENARDIHERSTSELGERALIFEGVHFEALYVDPDEWNEIREELTLEEALWRAATESHAGEAERIIDAFDRLGPVPELSTKSMVIMPTPIVGALADAGLSHRQAVIQALRMDGDSQERIGQKVGIATGTVKSHCDRIDRKLEQAERLLAIVDRNSS